jgi:hypothetical protein
VCGLIPKPENECSIVDSESGQSRLVRDLENGTDTSIRGLNISIYDAGKAVASTRPIDSRDPRIINYITIFVQMVAVAALIAAALFGYGTDIMTTMLILFGLNLGALTTLLAGIRAEGFITCTDGGANKMYALMRSNGQRHVFIIRNVHQNALNLEDFANATVTDYDWLGTRDGYILIGTTLGWPIFTVLACHLPHDAGFLFGVMALSSVSNMLVAACPPGFFHRIAQIINTMPGADKRNPLVFKIPFPIDLTFRRSLAHETDAMEALKGLENEFPGFGEELLKTFFSMRLSSEDELFWADAKASMNRRKHTREPEEANNDIKRARDETFVEPKGDREAKTDEVKSTEDGGAVVEEGSIAIDDNPSLSFSSSSWSTSSSSSSSDVVAKKDSEANKEEQEQEAEKEQHIGIKESVMEGDGSGPKKAYLKARRRG